MSLRIHRCKSKIILKRVLNKCVVKAMILYICRILYSGGKKYSVQYFGRWVFAFGENLMCLNFFHSTLKIVAADRLETFLVITKLHDFAHQKVIILIFL
jgi:hypothetical protein